MDTAGLSVKSCNDIPYEFLKMLIRFADEDLDLEVHNITWKMIYEQEQDSRSKLELLFSG